MSAFASKNMNEQESLRWPMGSPELLRCDIADGFTFAAVGDVLQVSPEMPKADPGFLALTQLLQEADAAFANGEITLFDIRTFTGHPAAEKGGGFTLGIPGVARDMREQGFTFVARANNHAMDWGADGMRETDRLFDAAGLTIAGTGNSRALARGAQYGVIRQGRIGLVAATSTFTPMSEAGPALGQALPRPGVSVLKTTPHIRVPAQVVAGLRHGYGENRRPAVIGAFSDRASKPSGRDDQLNIFGLTFQASETPGLSYVLDEDDTQDILRAIRQAKQASNFVVFSIHSHESATGRFNDTPTPDFLETIARLAVDSGADIVTGHGPHVLRGIEIYKGKPIFYSLGNFFFQLDLLEGLPRDDKNPECLTEYERVAPLMARSFDNPLLYQSIVAVSTFVAGHVTKIELHPIDLGAQRMPNRRGVPAPADPATAVAILNNLRDLSRPYGTEIAIKGHVGVISAA